MTCVGVRAIHIGERGGMKERIDIEKLGAGSDVEIGAIRWHGEEAAIQFGLRGVDIQVLELLRIEPLRKRLDRHDVVRRVVVVVRDTVHAAIVNRLDGVEARPRDERSETRLRIVLARQCADTQRSKARFGPAAPRLLCGRI